MARNTREIREKAVKEAQAGNRSLLEVAWEFGISTTTLRNWVRAAETREQSQGRVKKVAAALSKEIYSEPNQRMRLLIHALEQSPATIIITDTEARIIYANPKFVETTGYTIEEVQGKTPRLLKSGHTPPEEYGNLWTTINAGREWRGEFHNRRKDGTCYWEQASISPVFDAAGKITHFMAVKENITEFKAADEARRRSEERFRAVVTALAEGVLLLDGEHRIILANRAAEQILDHEAEQLLGRAIEDLNLRWLSERGESITRQSHPLYQALVTGETLRQRIFGVITARGRMTWLSLSIVALPGGTADASAIVSFSDVTERRAGEERLRLVGSVFDNAIEGVMITDGNNRIKAVNAAFSDITGYGLDEVIGKTPTLLASGKHDAVFYREMWTSLAKAGRWQGQVWNRRKNGFLYLAWLSITAVRDGEGNTREYVALFFDINEGRH